MRTRPRIRIRISFFAQTRDQRRDNEPPIFLEIRGFLSKLRLSQGAGIWRPERGLGIAFDRGGQEPRFCWQEDQVLQQGVEESH